MRRKLFAIAIFLIIVQMILQPISICAAVFSTSKSKEAIIMYGNPDIYENASVTLSGNQSKVDISGKKALELGTSDPNLYMFVDINDDFIYAPQGTAVKISVEYLDKGNGKFSVSYDGINNGNTGITDAETVNLNNTGEWLVHDFLIDDIKCINGISQADFRIATCSDVMGKSSESVYIASVIVNKSLSTNPALISVQSGHVGNIYGGDDDKKMTVNFKSIYDNILKAKISYKVINSSNNICDRGEFETEIGEGEEFNQIIDLNKCDRFDTYKLELNMNYSAIINGETKESENTETFKFSVANKSKAGEGNKHLKTNAYIQYPEESLTLTVDAGFGGLRNGTYWPYYEQTVKGQYDGAGAGGHKNHREMNDNIESESAKLHLSNMRMIIGGNPLYEPVKFADSGAAARPEVVVPTSDEAIQGFANFAAHIATRYKDTIDSIEVWNEFNIKGFNYYLNDGADYAKLLKATYTAVKAVNPDITVIALTPAYDPSNSLFKDFVEKALANGAYDYMDAVSFHPYDGANAGYRLWYLKERVEQFREMFKPYGEPKPIWITEIGSSTVTNKAFGATESRQAANFVRICTYAIGEKFADNITWYNLINTGKDVNNTEHWWGLVYSANSGKDAFVAKPAYISAAAMNKMLYDAEIADKFINEDTNVYAYDFKDSAGNDTAVVWSESGQQTIGLSLGTSKIDLYDINSNHIGTMESEDGNYSFSVDIDAVYIKGRFSEFKESTPDVAHDDFNISSVSGDTIVIGLSDKKKRTLRVETELPEDITLLSSTYNTADGQGSIYLKTSESAKDSYVGAVRLYDGDNLVYSSKLNINITDIISVYASSSQISETDFNHWQGNIHISNNSYEIPVSGTCKLIMADGKPLTTNIAKFNNLGGKKSITLYINLPEMIKKRVTEFVFEIETLSGEKKQLQQRLDFTSAQNCSIAKPNIDGDIEQGEWFGTWSVVDKEEEMSSTKDWGGKDDLSYNFNIMWDEDNFYMAAVVNDDIHYQVEAPENSWRGDGIQIGLESNINKFGVAALPENAVTYSDFTELGVAFNGKESYVYRFGAQGRKNPAGLIENCSVAVKRTDGKTVYEMAIPWKEIFGEGYTVNSGTSLKFAMIVNENDGKGRELYAKYNDGIGSVKDAYKFGNLSLK